MAGPKKKSSKGKAPSKQPKQQPKGPAQAFLEQQQLLPPLERMASVRPLWQSLTPEEREAALTVPLDDLRAYAKEQAARNRLASEAEMVEAAAAGQIILTFDPALDEVLEQGLTRSKESGTWKVWHWPPDKTEFKDTDAFRKHLEEHLLGPEHLAVLPKDPEGSRPLEKPSEAAFRKRMQDLLLSVQEQRLAQDEEVAMASRRQGGRRQDPLVVMRDATTELIITILSTLEKEHDSIYQHCLFPVTSYICDVLPEGSYKTSRTELYPEDLESLLPEDIQRIFEFLQEKLDTLSTRLKPDAAELEQEDPDEEPIGDVDLFSLTPDGNALCVNDKWMSHLRSRVLGEDSQPRQAKDGEDPTKAGLALEWVYGTIVSTAEKGRDAAHRTIGNKPVSAEEAVEALVNALEEQAMWEQHARSSRELLSQMLTSRKEALEMGKKYDLRTTTAAAAAAAVPSSSGGVAIAGSSGISKPAAASISNASEATTTATPPAAGEVSSPAAATELPSLPPHVILFLLKREALLTAAKLHGLKLEQVTAKRELRSYQAQLRAGEPRFERLRRELDEMKSAPSRSLDGTYRNTSEMERHRSQLADAAIEDQMTAQAEFRKIGSRLQKIVDLKTEMEIQISRRDQEANQLQLWRRNVCQMVDSLEDNIAASAPLESLLLADGAGDVDEEAGEIDDAKRALIAAVKAATHHAEELETLRNNFNTTFRKELYVPADDIAIFETVQKQLKEIERRLEEGRVAAQHLLQFAINVACDDPGIAIGQNIVLPYLQEKLDLKGLDWANEKAAAAQDEVIRMELLLEDKQRQEKEKKAKAKAKAKEKARTEKERERADREAREREAREAEEEAKRQAEAAVEEARKKKAAELEALRLAEEELMERRRKELLADEDSHWSQRSQQRDEIRNAQAELEQQIVDEAAGNQSAAAAAPAPSSGGSSKGKDDGFIAAGASNSSKRNANRGRGKDSKERGEQQQQQESKEQPRKQKDASASNNKVNGNVPNGRGKQQPEQAANASSPLSAANTTNTATASSEPATTAVAPILVSPPTGADMAAAASSSPLAPSSPDRVESAQPATIQPTPLAGDAAPSLPLTPEQQQQQQQLPPLPLAAAAAGMPLPLPPHSGVPGPAMMAMPLPVPVVPLSMPVPLPGTVVGMPPPVPGVIVVAPPAVPVAALGPPSLSRAGSGFSGAGAEDLSHSPTALPHGLPLPPPPPPPRRNHPQQHLQQQQQQLPLPPPHYAGGPPPPLPVVLAPGTYTGPPPPHHPSMYYPGNNGEAPPPLPHQHMMRPGGPHPHPAMGYAMPLPQHTGGPPMGPIATGGAIPPPPPPPRLTASPSGSASHQSSAPGAGAPGGSGGPPTGMMHHHHPYHLQQHNGMLPPPPGVAMGQPIHGNGRPYHHQQQQQQFGQQQYHPQGGAAGGARYTSGFGNNSFSSGGGNAASRQLRAAAQPFVPSSNSFSMQESETVATPPPAVDGNKSEEAAPASSNDTAPPPGSNTSTRKEQHQGIDGEEASPRGILEPSEIAAANSKEAGLVTVSQGTASSTAGDEAASEASSRTAGSTMSDAGPIHGAFEAGQQEQMLALVGNGAAKAIVSPPAALTAPPSSAPPVVDMKKLKSVRGLSNSPGVYNCFLNVIIQSLWHLPAFRKALLSLTPAQMEKHAAGDDGNNTAQVLTSLRSIFEELNSHTDSSTTTEDDDTLPLQPVSPQQLREALGGSRFDHGNMHDAAEVLGELFDRLHVAEVGPNGRDPTLPRTVRVDAASVAGNATSGKKARNGANGTGTAGNAPVVSHIAKDSAWGNAAALKLVKQALALADAEASNSGGAGSTDKKKEPVSMVQKLFGMEVQAPVHNSSNNNNNNNSNGNGNTKGKSKGGNKSSSGNSSSATVEVLQFTRYFHLVPAQGLRIAAATSSSFEAALVAATGGGTAPPTERLLTKPAVFTLSTVFESPQVPAAALAATLSALRPELDISRLFLDVPNKGDEDNEGGANFKYRLRCMVCYSSSHYFAFAYSEHVGQWLLLDDAHVSAVGHWKDVQAAAAQRRLQPSLLFYEAISSA